VTLICIHPEIIHFRELSCHYHLESSRLSLDEIAHLVGFTETTNFRRAFKRWQGVPPARYRDGLAVISR
jgi:AraC-like DNA-binding protein